MLVQLLRWKQWNGRGNNTRKLYLHLKLAHILTPVCVFPQDSGASVDIGCGGEFGGGDADVDDTDENVNNVIDSSIGFDLHEVPLRKTDLKEYLTGYCKNVRQKLKDDSKVTGPEVKAFTQAAPLFCKWLLKMYDELQFYTSSSMDPDGSMAFSYYKGANPTFVFIKAGLYEEKC
jgi:Translationally controlled tumour protein